MALEDDAEGKFLHPRINVLFSDFLEKDRPSEIGLDARKRVSGLDDFIESQIDGDDAFLNAWKIRVHREAEKLRENKGAIRRMLSSQRQNLVDTPFLLHRISQHSSKTPAGIQWEMDQIQQAK